MEWWIAISIVPFVALLWLLRRDGLSLGIPVAYLATLLLNHIPGAIAHATPNSFLLNSDLVQLSVPFTATASVCFVLGVALTRFRVPRPIEPRPATRQRFWLFCVIGGWVLTYGLAALHDIPSIGAAVDKGAALWMLGVLLGLRAAFRRSDVKWIVIWTGALLVYPILTVLLGGFLSYGAQAALVVCSALTISTRSTWRLAVGIPVMAFLGMSLFVNYFQNRNNLRERVWHGAPMAERADSVADIFRSFEWFSTSNVKHLDALDQRLNQNYFVGLAARRIDQGQVGYLYGTSIWEGILSLVPRAIWPEKPVFAGSPEIVSQMTGLPLSRKTSFGVGNVMEFQINFGWWGIVVGFASLGWALGTLDLKAASAEARGDLGSIPLFFLPGVALIQPGGSIVEMFSGSAAALIAAIGWYFAWREFNRMTRRKRAFQATSVRIPKAPLQTRPARVAHESDV